MTFLFLSVTAFAQEYVYLTMNGAIIGESTTLNLQKDSRYIFYGSGSKNVDNVVIYVKGEGLLNEGPTASIAFTPSFEKTYELDIIGFQGSKQKASQKFHLIVNAERACVEKWECTEWSECEGGFRSRSCTDINQCGTFYNKPEEGSACQAPTSDSEGVEDNNVTISANHDGDVSDLPDTNVFPENCGTYDEENFISVCEYTKCKKTTHDFHITNADFNAIFRIVFLPPNPNAPPPNVNDHNQGLGKNDILIVIPDPTGLYVNFENIYYDSLFDGIGHQIANDVCSELYNIYSKLQSLDNTKRNEEEAEENRNANFNILIIPVDWIDTSAYDSEALTTKTSLKSALPFDECREKISVVIADMQDYGEHWQDGSCLIPFEQCSNFRILGSEYRFSSDSSQTTNNPDTLQTIMNCAIEYQEKTGILYDRVVGLFENNFKVHSEDCQNPKGGGWTTFYGNVVIANSFQSSIHEIGHTFGLNEQYCDAEYFLSLGFEPSDIDGFDVKYFTLNPNFEDHKEDMCGRFDRINPLKSALGCGGALDKTCFDKNFDINGARVKGNFDRFWKSGNNGKRTAMGNTYLSQNQFSADEYNHIKKFTNCDVKFSQSNLLVNSPARWAS